MTKKSLSDFISHEEYDQAINDIIVRLEQACDNTEVGYRIVLAVLALMADMTDRSDKEVIDDVTDMVTQVSAMRERHEQGGDAHFVQGNGTIN